MNKLMANFGIAMAVLCGSVNASDVVFPIDAPKEIKPIDVSYMHDGKKKKVRFYIWAERSNLWLKYVPATNKPYWDPIIESNGIYVAQYGKKYEIYFNTEYTSYSSTGPSSRDILMITPSGKGFSKDNSFSLYISPDDFDRLYSSGLVKIIDFQSLNSEHPYSSSVSPDRLGLDSVICENKTNGLAFEASITPGQVTFPCDESKLKSQPGDEIVIQIKGKKE